MVTKNFFFIEIRQVVMKHASDLLRRKGRDIWAVSPESTVYHAIEMMAQKGIGALLVMEGEKLVGIVSERDYARKVILRGKLSRETLVSEIMSKPVICVGPELSIEETMSIMTENRVRHLPVVVGERVIGVISIGDVVRGIIEDQEFQIHELTKYITGI
jgi:CBS domain-containing protein